MLAELAVAGVCPRIRTLPRTTWWSGVEAPLVCIF
jgi:hypothetical protein